MYKRYPTNNDNLVKLLFQDIWVMGKAMCLLVPFIELTVSHTSVLTILAITVERSVPSSSLGPQEDHSDIPFIFVSSHCFSHYKIRSKSENYNETE